MWIDYQMQKTRLKMAEERARVKCRFPCKVLIVEGQELYTRDRSADALRLDRGDSGEISKHRGYMVKQVGGRYMESKREAG
jgi:hypothetical protein